MPEFFSSDGSLPLQFLVIFGVILVAMLAVYALFRRFFGRGLSVPARTGSRSRQPRLGIVDIYELDQRRQLILLRRDNVEHLLLVGGPNDVVVERNVQRVAGSRLPADTMIRPEPASDMPFLPGQDDRDEVPPFAMPVTMSPTLPEPEDAHTPRIDPPQFEPKLDAADKASRPEPTPVIAAAPAPARRDRTDPLRREVAPVDEPWREAAAERAASSATAPEPAVPATPTAPAAEVRPAARSAVSSMARQFETVLRKQAAPSARSAPEPTGTVERTPPPIPPVVPTAPPPSDPTPAPVADPIRQPVPEPMLPRVAEGPVPISATEVPPPPPKSEAATDPVAAGMSSAQDPSPEPAPEPEPVAPPIPAAPPARPAAEIRPVPEPTRTTPEPIRPAPAPLRPAPQPAAPAQPAVQQGARIEERNLERPLERLREQPLERLADRPLSRPEPNVVAVKPVRPASVPPLPPEDKPAQETRRGANPFSVEEIEAEFARLLGRPLSRRD